jgi:hypothetical protein
MSLTTPLPSPDFATALTSSPRTGCVPHFLDLRIVDAGPQEGIS